MPTGRQTEQTELTNRRMKTGSPRKIDAHSTLRHADAFEVGLAALHILDGLWFKKGREGMRHVSGFRAPRHGGRPHIGRRPSQGKFLFCSPRAHDSPLNVLLPD